MNHHLRPFYWAAALLLLLIGLLASVTTSKADDLSGFYSWANRVVSSTKLRAPQGEFIIYVKPGWEDKNVPWAYRLWLGGYTLCKNYPTQFRFESAILSHEIVLDPKLLRWTDFPARGIMPFARCKTFLEKIEEQIKERW